MKQRFVSVVALLVVVTVLVMVFAAWVLAAYNNYGDLSYLIAVGSGAIVDGLIAWWQPRNPVGWCISGTAFSFSTGEFTRQYAIYGLATQPGALPWARALASPPYWVWFPGVICVFVLLPLYFPNGRLLSPRWRPMIWYTVVLASIMTGLAALRPGSDETLGIPNPLGVPWLAPLFEAVPFIWTILWLSLGVAATASLVLRFRWARGEERQQIKWVVYALVLLVATTIVAQLFFASVDSLVSPLLLLLALQGLWVAIAVAVFKYRLYGIDVLINRTLVYGTLTGLLAAIYVGSVVVLQRLLTPLISQNDQIVIEASTLAIAAPFQPLRRRVQAIIDRCFYRRYSARRTLEAFSAKLRNETDLLMLTDNLVHVVHDTLQPADVSVLLIDPKKQ